MSENRFEISAANAIMLNSPRVYYAMAKDGLFFCSLSQVHPRFGTPAFAIGIAGIWSAVLAASGRFEQLLTYVVFIGWMFYALAAASVFVYRRRDPEGSRPYRVPAYPLTPLVFILAASALVVNTVVRQPVQAGVGLGIVLLGAPAYALWRRNAKLSGREYIERSKLQAQIQTAICLDECISNLNHDARAAIELKACRIIKIKLGRVSGHTEARQVQASCLKSGIPVWCGGMLEAGIRRAHNIAMSTLPGFTLPSDVSASERYWSEDIIEPAVEVTSKGTIRVPQTPGLGYVAKRDFVEKLTVRRDNWGAPAFVSPAVEVPSC